MDAPSGKPLEAIAATGETSSGGLNPQYVVVARRYRPQAFEQLIGQEHVARALTNAIAANRVGHAYLFTGARGVGKTSAARILAKALDCVHGPTATPCNVCDICQSISAGSDVDVLEIDGASNRGIDEIRQLRQNVNVRPSRARFKIYIIDEVHMLTREAFNALLKTLEEPPEHVKFIFCTTEASKIPITILSRCQRFDFAGIDQGSILSRLEQIVAAEGVTAEPEALAILARRANGSMRDSQSLLEQLLAVGEKRITAADVHAMLGTAGEVRLSGVVGHLIDRDAAAAIADLDEALAEGVDVGQLLEQLLGYLRDAMASAVGCPSDAFLHTSPAEQTKVQEAGQRLGLETILAMMQIVDQTLSRLRYSTQGRTLAEMALVRIAQLENLEELSALLAELREGEGAGNSRPASAAPRGAVESRGPSGAAAESPSLASELAKKKAALGDPAEAASPAAAVPSAAAATSPPADVAPAELARPSAPRQVLDSTTADSVWRQALANLSDLLAETASFCDSVGVTADQRLVVRFRAKYTSCKAFCERPEQLSRLEAALAEVVGRPLKVQFAMLEDEQPQRPAQSRPMPERQRLASMTEHPLIKRAGELFDARLVKVEEPGS